MCHLPTERPVAIAQVPATIMLIRAQAKAKAIATHVEGRATLSGPMAVAMKIAAPMAKAVKTTTAGDKIRDDEELIVYPLALRRLRDRRCRQHPPRK
jgi:hypothetical protein